MERLYKKLYRFLVEHTYYKDLTCKDFVFAPIGDTASLMRVHGLIYKSFENGFDLIYKAEDAGGNPSIPFIDKRILRFGIALRNPEIHYYTDFPVKTNDTDIYWTSGDYETSSLAFSAMQTRQPAFTASYSYTFNKLTFRIVDEDNNTRYETSKEAEESEENPGTYEFNFSVNLGNETLGRYKLQTFHNGILQDEEEVFILNRFEFKDLTGILEVELNESLEYTDLPHSSKLELNPTSTVWKYEIELTRDLGTGTLEILDVNEGPITFTETSALVSYDKGEIVVFEASGPIQKSQLAYTNFNLEVDTTELELTLNSLPNPSNHNANSIIYLKL